MHARTPSKDVAKKGIAPAPAVLGSVFVVGTARIDELVVLKSIAWEGFHNFAHLEHHFMRDVGAAAVTDGGGQVKAGRRTQRHEC